MYTYISIAILNQIVIQYDTRVFPKFFSLSTEVFSISLGIIKSNKFEIILNEEEREKFVFSDTDSFHSTFEFIFRMQHAYVI